MNVSTAHFKATVIFEKRVNPSGEDSFFFYSSAPMAKSKNFLTPIIVIFLLVGFPAISYYYLSTGFDYRKEAILTQGDFGKMPDLLALTQVRGKLPSKLRGSMVVVGWLNPNNVSAAGKYGNMLDSLYNQFEDSPNLHFTTVVPASNGKAAADQFATTHNLPDTEMLSFLEADATTYASTAEAFQLPLGEDSPGQRPIVALVDSSQTIVKHYDLGNRQEAIGLVELISVIIPLPERQDILLNRKKEL
ncbi:hypothetical protein A3850_011070 [Lewinella sp. 4G2]|nr:hypothetical protein A3850_011070 [Lewinella sp. 4G2]